MLDYSMKKLNEALEEAGFDHISFSDSDDESIEDENLLYSTRFDFASSYSKSIRVNSLL